MDNMWGRHQYVEKQNFCTGGQVHVYPLRTALLNEHAHVADFWHVLPVIPCPFARLPCLLRHKLKEIKAHKMYPEW